MKRVVFNIFLFAIMAISLSSCGYNTMVEKQVAVDQQWAQVENNYQRRADLIPNLVETVKGYANFEKSTLTDVIQARKYASDVKIDASNLSPEQIQNFDKAQQSLSAALGRFLSVAENYPDLKANEGFRDLRVELAGTENRISTARKRFNDAVADYNITIRKFPNNMFAGMFGFEKKGFFESKPGSDVAPTVKF